MTKIEKAVKFMELFRGDEDHEIWMVGGAVRDMVLGIDPDDIDFSTPKTPEVIKEILMEGGVFKRNIDMQDAKVGTVVVTYDDEVYEITTFRKETYLPNSRRPIVEFTTDMYEDAVRRDFNINSIYWDGVKFFDPMRGLWYVGGEYIPGKLEPFLENNKAPNVTFNEDPLRVLRALRFATKYDSRDLTDARRSVDLITHLSFQTIRKEIEKGFKVAGMYKVYREAKVFDMFIPYYDGARERAATTNNFTPSGNPISCWAFLLSVHIGLPGMGNKERIILIRKSLKMMEFSKEDIESIVAATGLENQYLRDSWVQKSPMERLHGS